MALTKEQERIYASAPLGEIFKQALSLSHPSFTKTWHITNYPIPFSGYADGVLVLFEQVPFMAQEPQNDDQGQADMRIVIDNVNPEIMREIEAAADDFSVAINCDYRVYSNNDPTPAMDPPLRLQLSQVEATLYTINSTATRADIINAPWPRSAYTTHQFPGLSR